MMISATKVPVAFQMMCHTTGMSDRLMTPHARARIAPIVALQPTPRPLGCQMTRTMVKIKIAIATSMSKRSDGSAAIAGALWSVAHCIQTQRVVLQPWLVGLQSGVEHLCHPGGQCRIDAVIDPLALATVLQQPTTAQLRQVAGDFWLTVVQSMDQFAHAKFALAQDQ